MGAKLQLNINKTAASPYRSRGGCYTTSTNTLTVCLPGKVGLYLFNETTKSWPAYRPPQSMLFAAISSMQFEDLCLNDSDISAGRFCFDLADSSGFSFSPQQCPSPDDQCITLTRIKGESIEEKLESRLNSDEDEIYLSVEDYLEIWDEDDDVGPHTFFERDTEKKIYFKMDTTSWTLVMDVYSLNHVLISKMFYSDRPIAPPHGVNHSTTHPT